ncbi:MAG: hypothetical protein JWQ38_3534, partial [Flavipsychrobacter sp.]|nr:hypothetical protein [Flavipsychrobacter sp.]
PRRTVHYWIRQNSWDIQKENAAHMPALIVENCYHVIARYTEQLMSGDRAETPVTYKEADTLYKLAMTLNKLKGRISLNESMQVMGNFMESVEKIAPTMTDCILPFADQFIAENAIAARKARQAKPSEVLLFRPTNTEKQQDLDDIAAWQQENKMPEDADEKPTASVADMRRRSNFRSPGDAHAAALHHRQAKPTYEQFIADMQKQDETLKHLFPLNTKHTRAA